MKQITESTSIQTPPKFTKIKPKTSGKEKFCHSQASNTEKALRCSLATIDPHPHSQDQNQFVPFNGMKYAKSAETKLKKKKIKTRHFSSFLIKIGRKLLISSTLQ
ncbi:hypothetical protein CEXT_689581 [Caerostris extrusa]|uniref:Uncharacterized protein n=1 Tax=Caerostris extrusa TaxID=172846 RepID=A0AAV4WE18_CAEEX|nr:hypothetical protein CEXT_689581 [Caerostris extrusa]